MLLEFSPDFYEKLSKVKIITKMCWNLQICGTKGTGNKPLQASICVAAIHTAQVC